MAITATAVHVRYYRYVQYSNRKRRMLASRGDTVLYYQYWQATTLVVVRSIRTPTDSMVPV